jgi:hypothetical protein
MKTIHLLFLAAMVTTATAQTSLITIPWVVDPSNGTNYSRTNLPAWWDGGTNFWAWAGGTNFHKGVTPWMAWQAANENFRRLSSGTNAWVATNSAPPTAATIGGSAYLWNSNGTVYLLTSSPASTSWAATNKLGP